MKYSKINYVEHNSSLNYKAFEEEAVIHSKAVYHFALSMTGNPEDANDLVQETYLKAFKHFNNFTKGSNCKAWLFMILKNTFINEYRKKKREPYKVNYDDIEEFYETIKPEQIDPGENLDSIYADTFDDDISKAIAELPENFRSIVLLCDMEGYSYEEIAEHIQCPIGTVRSRLHRARKQLQSKLQKYAENNGYIKNIKENDSDKNDVELAFAG
ncbi:MAG: sigma-70 family RNA polymerase sigma factor [Ignavibacteriae bacterium]|nr:sigma-70 family RNA polymerase sigma factor [Ignavibacteriota bacterium]NOG99212.1 sigma-70 family RNA polymerase sigma factor [Ignavibacteriota bacterium]